MIIAGIDPGQSGGVAFVDGTSLTTYPMPVLDKRVQVNEVITLLDMMAPSLVVVELQSIRNGQAGALAIGANYGRVLAAIECLGLPHRIVSPISWNKRAGIPAGLSGRPKKEASYAVAKRTWGKAFDALKLPISKDGQYEALLIAYYGS